MFRIFSYTIVPLLWPTSALTWTVLRAGITAARELRDGTITRSRLENFLREIFVKYRHRKRFPDRRVQLPMVDVLWLALDIDTEEEAREKGGDLSPGDSVP